MEALHKLAFRCSIHTKPFPHSSLQNQLLYRRPITTSEISATEQSPTVNYLIKSCGFSPEAAISASKYFKLRSPERADSVLAFLRNHGGLSETQITKIIRSYPAYLATVNPEKTLLPKIEFYISLGISKEDLARTVSSNPMLLAMNLENRIVPTYNFLKSFLLSEKNVATVVTNGGWIFLEGHSKNVVPNIKFLRGIGMSEPCISKFLTHFTQYLMLKREKFCQVVHDVREMGFSVEKYSNFGSAIRAFSVENSKLKMSQCRQLYMSHWGWSENDVLSALRRFPGCMIQSEKKIMQVMEFLVNKMELVSSRMIAKYPLVWTTSFDKRIIPRCLVFKVLLLKGLINENLSLGYVLYLSEEKFLGRFVIKYLDQVPQLLSVYQGTVGIQDV